MKYCRFFQNQEPQFGLIESIAGREMITRVFSGPGAVAALPDEDAPTARITPLAMEEARVLAPVRPSKIICVGRNYREHARELGNEVPTQLLIFLKPPSAVLSPGEQIVRPRVSERVDYEGELGVIIGRTCRKLREADEVKPYIHGYTCVNDVTARDLQNKDGQWTRAKGFDTFCPVGPAVSDELDPWAGVGVETRVNGEVKQQGNTTQFIFPLDEIIRYISGVMTLYPGDLIATGTPAGVGPVKAGDVVEIGVEGVGALRNSVVDEAG